VAADHANLKQGNQMKTSYLSLLPVTFILAACGGAPSDSDIKTALEKAVSDQQKAMAAVGGSAMGNLFKIDYTSVKKIGCKEDGEKAYRCDVEVSAKTALGEQKQVSSMRLVKGSDGWVAGR
jgi:hypothetical protein